MKRGPVIAVVVVVLCGCALIAGWRYRHPAQSLYAREFRQIDLAALPVQEGVIRHLVEDFSTYGDCSRVLDGFEDTAGLLSNGRLEGTTRENRGGAHAVRLVATAAETTVSRALNADLSRWQEQGGVLTAWVKLADEREVDRIDLILRDADGVEARLVGLDNLHIPREQNRLKSDDEFPDYFFLGRQPNRKWEDFMLISGWNFLFWELPRELPIDMRRVTGYTLVILRNTADEQAMVCDNLRIQDGLLGDRNSLGANWYPPNGLPMYGIFDYDGPGRVRLQNVEWEQYPSNGDHVRILSREGTPDDFIMRLRFSVLELAPAARSTPRWLRRWVTPPDPHPRYNTYFRLQWDFDNAFDPGHDWSGLYHALEYEYLGLCRVYPIERYFEQGADPDQHAVEGRTSFCLQAQRTYEINVKVEGARASAVVYEVRGRWLKRMAAVAYTFRKARPTTRYPVSVETTGNLQIELHAIEVAALR